MPPEPPTHPDRTPRWPTVPPNRLEDRDRPRPLRHEHRSFRLTVNHSITLDQGWNAVDLAVDLQPLAASNVRFETIPIVRPDLDTGTDGQAVQVDPLQVQAFVRTAIDPRSPSAPAAEPAPVTVDVLNASGATGLATAAMAALTRDGLPGGHVGNVPSARTSIIRFSPGGDLGAATVARDLGAPTAPTLDPRLAPGRVVVILGTDSASLRPPATPAPPTPAPPPPVTADMVPCIN